MERVVKFERFKDVTNWSLFEIRDYAKQQGWSGLKIHLPKTDDDPVMVERLPS